MQIPNGVKVPNIPNIATQASKVLSTASTINSALGIFGYKNRSGAMLKGLLINMDTMKMHRFQFNPTTLSFGRSANYSEIKSPGIPYPITQYVNGNAREFSVELFMYDHPYGGRIDSFREFLYDLLPPEVNTSAKRPPVALFYYGTFIKKCVLTGLDVEVQRHNKYGLPIQAVFQCNFRQVSL